MNKKPLSLITLALLPAALTTLTSCSSTPTPPPPPETSSDASFQPGVPGGVKVKTTELSARVTAIDRANRELTLLGSDGETSIVNAGPNAANFNRIRVGDLVTATVTEKVVAHLAEGNEHPGGRASSVVLIAPEGSPPGSVSVETKYTTATVIAIDLQQHQATLRFKDGSTRTYPVRKDVDLSKRKVGEQVVFQVTETMAIRIEKR